MGSGRFEAPLLTLAACDDTLHTVHRAAYNVLPRERGGDPGFGRARRRWATAASRRACSSRRARCSRTSRPGAAWRPRSCGCTSSRRPWTPRARPTRPRPGRRRAAPTPAHRAQPRGAASARAGPCGLPRRRHPALCPAAVCGRAWPGPGGVRRGADSSGRPCLAVRLAPQRRADRRRCARARGLCGAGAPALYDVRGT